MAKSLYPQASVDSIAEYASGSHNRSPEPPPPPPPPADTTIGTVTVSGNATVTENDVASYTASHDGDSDDLSYAWAIEGGTGTSATETCEVTWGSAGDGKVTCTITSTDETCTDSPQSGELDVTISA